MPKIKLGQAPKTFPSQVTFDLVQGGTDSITVDFVYRNRAEYAEFINEIYPAIKTGVTQPADVSYDVVAEDAKTRAKEAAFIAAAASGWDLEEPFNAANVTRLVNEFPAAGAAIRQAYYLAINEGRAKN